MIVRGGAFLVVTRHRDLCVRRRGLRAVGVGAQRARAAPRRSVNAPSPWRGSTRACVCGSPRPRSGGSSAGMVFTAVMALAPRVVNHTSRRSAGYIAIGAVQLMLAAWFAFAFRYYQTRSADACETRRDRRLADADDPAALRPEPASDGTIAPPDRVIFAPCTFSMNSPPAACWPTSPIATPSKSC